jgi:ribokinase
MSSGVALIFVADDGENMIGVASGANLALTPEDVDRLPGSLFRAGDVLLAGLEIPVETAVRALHRGARAGMRTILNPAPVPSIAADRVRELLAAAEVVTPNRVEAAALAGTDRPDDASAMARALIALGARGVVVTMGVDGCLVASVDEEPGRIPAPRVEAVDTVGAGDAFTGALAVAIAEGRSLHEAAAWACAAAALAVTRPGAQAALPSRDAIDQLSARDGRI